MWETPGYRNPKSKYAEHTASADRNVSRQKNASKSALSPADVQIRYSPSAYVPSVIQLKQTTPLAARLRAQGIDVRSLGAEAEGLVTSYDSLENTSATRDSQHGYLYALIDLLSGQLARNAGNVTLETALRLLQDELNLVKLQYSARNSEASATGTASPAGSETPPTPPDEPWEHMDSSPFLRTIAAYIRHQAAGGDAEARALSASAIPERENFSALHFIKGLSSHHMNRLISGESLPPAPLPAATHHGLRGRLFSRRLPAAPNPAERMSALTTLANQIAKMLARDGMLSHYTHNPNLKVLHSTDYLKANRVLSREKLAKDDAVAETETVSKSQDVDTDFFRNTGFVFFFLERSGAPLRGTGFGKYRYTVKLTDSPSILKNAWAILHDMAGMSQKKRGIQKAQKTQRVIEPISDISDAPALLDELPQFLSASPAALSASSTSTSSASSASAPSAGSTTASSAPEFSLFSMLSLFLPSAKQDIKLETPDGQQHDTGIHDRISGNFLQGDDIIYGIALRAAHELMTLRDYCESEYTALTSDANALWEYLLSMVHDMQIMVPQDVLPAQYDFIGESRLITRPVHADAAERRPGREQTGAGEHLPLRSANNCFFDTMHAVMHAPEFADSGDLRTRFTDQQRTCGMQNPLAQDQPVEDAHVQQFADIFHVAITVMIMAPRQEPVMMDFDPHDGAAAQHYYIRYLPPSSPEGIGHFTPL